MWLPVRSLVGRVNYHMPQLKMAASFIFVTTVCSWREGPSTCFFPEVPGRSWATHFPLSFSTGSSCFMPCSPSRDPVSISKSSSLTSPHLYHPITVRTLYLRLPRLVPSSPYYNCRCTVPARCKFF